MRLLRVLFLASTSVAAIAATAPAPALAFSAPGLDAPADDAHVESSPAFTWHTVKSAAQYEFQLAADRGFGSIVLGSGPRKGTFKTKNTAGTLDDSIPNGEYFWRVRAISAHDTAGPWSTIRSFTKAWTTAPQLVGPLDAFSVNWPSLPLILQWTPVQYATKYIVTVATDPSLSAPVLGSSTDPVKTQGTTFALPGTLAPGQYFWAITPVDAAGHAGQRSRVGSFSWSWPTQTNTYFTNLGDPDNVHADPDSIIEPQFSWDPVQGASAYELEVNFDSDFASGSTVLLERTTGLSLSPKVVLADNTYHWRVRALDSGGNAGVWNVGPDFTKSFDTVAPSIQNLRVLDNNGNPAGAPGVDPLLTSTTVPVVTWDPVQGAAGYEVIVRAYLGGICDTKIYDDYTATPAWTPLGSGGSNQGPNSWPGPTNQGAGALGAGTYCVSVSAYTDYVSSRNGYNSPQTTLSPAFTFVQPTAGGATPLAMSDANYLGPKGGVVSPRMPVFTWQPITNAGGYYVIVARDPNFIQIIDHAFTNIPAYAPRGPGGSKTYADETTSYYWEIVPTRTLNGNTIPSAPENFAAHHPQNFKKQSVPPTLLGPINGASVPTQPTFRWSRAEAARSYRIQVSQDPTFGNTIDDVVTDSTAYTSSSTYPADTVLYWRARANDDDQAKGLTWSSTGTFRRSLPVPSPAPGNPLAGETIPVLSWTPVQGAVSYDLHVDQVDGTGKDFTVSSTSFTPIAFYGNGIWHWKVRANFPTFGFGKVSGGYFAPSQSFVRLIGPTHNVRGSKTGSRVLLSWDPTEAATKYRIEISKTTGFGSPIDSATVATTDYAPDLTNSAYQEGGTLYWRVASVDDGNNVGAYSTGIFKFPKAIHVTLTGFLTHGKRGKVVVKLEDPNHHRIRSAKIRVTGKGLRTVRKRSGKKGTATFSLRPRRRGTLTFKVTKSGYRDATATLKVN